MKLACHSSTIYGVPDSPGGQRRMAVAHEVMDRSKTLLNGIALNRKVSGGSWLVGIRLCKIQRHSVVHAVKPP